MDFKKKYFFLLSCFLFFFLQISFSSDFLHQDKIKKALSYVIDPDIRCFLNIISLCEGTSKKKKEKIACFKPSWSEYLVSFGYKEKIDLVAYPEKLFCIRGKKDLCSSASGRYQFIEKTWKHLIKRYKQKNIFLKNKNFFIDFLDNMSGYYDQTVLKHYKNVDDFLYFKFGPFWQDFYAVLLLMQAGLIELIKSKNIEKVCQKISFIWPSFPKNKFNESRYHDGVNNAQSFKKIVRLFELQMKKRSQGEIK
jgi:muramidase (phage lysozyme)